MATISTLAGQISTLAIDLAHLTAASSLPQPTFSPTGATAFSKETLEIRKARTELAAAASQLARLAQGPEDHILSLSWSSADTANLAVVVRFNIPQEVPLSGSPISSAELSSKTKLPEDILCRTVRYAIGNGLFTEPSAGTFTHSASSALLATDPHLRAIASLSAQEQAQVLLRISDALHIAQVAPTPPQNGGPKHKGPWPPVAFNLTYPDYESVFELAAKDPEKAARYHEYMVGRAQTSRWKIDHLLAAYDWSALSGKTVVDAGGSMGHTAIALAAFTPPDVKFVVQDVDPTALQHGQAMLKGMAEVPDPVKQKLEFEEHDFFKPQTRKGDIWIFRHIFHDWTDQDVIKILKALVPALSNGERVLVSEGIVPEPPAEVVGGLDGKQILVEDLLMMASHGAKERTVKDFESLFKAADQKFKLVGTTGGIGGAFQSLVEFVFEG